jgi:hypothetical protein
MRQHAMSAVLLLAAYAYRRLVSAVRGDMLTYADVCWRMGRMLTHAGVCV